MPGGARSGGRVATDGAARLVTHEPYTATDLEPGVESTVSWQLQAVSYDVPAGHRLALVVNSRDPLYSTVAVTGGTTTISSPTGSAAALELPLG
ncbi:CocE/NonD family hydrolase C-terminal non-catalytic domain-containing protein [Kitasatospora griseola]|uniref:CocE/NonD family hydrolase C-terminal non-catalytic domain-containing protein n=1 Tax=Kitasatospora griseola TaxID=2064 RepID=UPI00342F122B